MRRAGHRIFGDFNRRRGDGWLFLGVSGGDTDDCCFGGIRTVDPAHTLIGVQICNQAGVGGAGLNC